MDNIQTFFIKNESDYNNIVKYFSNENYSNMGGYI